MTQRKICRRHRIHYPPHNWPVVGITKERMMSHYLHVKSTPAGGRVLLAFSLAAVAIASSWQPVAESLSIPRSSGISGRGPNGGVGSILGDLDRSNLGGSAHSRSGRKNNGRGYGSIVMASSSQSQDVEGTDEAITEAVIHNENLRDVISDSTSTPLPSDGEDHTTTHMQIAPNVKNEDEYISIWPQFDALDRRMIKIALPCIANFAINPLIGAVDLFWVNRMGNALAVAGQAAANQVFSSAFWVVSFLPSGEFSCCRLEYFFIFCFLDFDFSVISSLNLPPIVSSCHVSNGNIGVQSQR